MEFRILGPLEVVADGRPLALGGRGGRVVTAVLLLRAGEPVTDDVLIEALQGAEASPSGRRALQVQVSRLRSRLGPAAERLVTADGGYRLEVADGELDAARFEALCARAREEHPAAAAATLCDALALWRGPALADLRYEAFAQAEIARLDELRWSALEARVEAELASGRDGGLVAELERLAAEAPLRERLIELRMRALYRAGRHVEALAVYRDARRYLNEELGLEPGPALRELERAILAHDPALSAEAGPRRALAEPPTRTIGREEELVTLVGALGENRLVTLTGPGGVGKTRLAVEAARALAGDYHGRVHVAWLAPVASAQDVPAALAAAASVTPQPGEPMEDALARRLSGAPALLVADNLEHVLPAASLLGDLLAGCPRLRILATSREPLRLRGERCLLVGPLAARHAIELFTARARDRRPDFRVTDENEAAVAGLCRLLDGLPLALELAAGRVGLLEPEHLVARLSDALPLLEGGPRDAPARQRTIRATLEWSAALLNDDERSAFEALSVFVGGAAVETAEHVTGSSLGTLDALVAKSLARLRHGRVVQLEVVRQFAAAELSRSPAHDDVRTRHAGWALALAEELAPEIRVRGEGAATQRLEHELGNLGAAFDWWLVRNDAERSLRLATATAAFWEIRVAEREGVRALDAALRLGGPARERGRALLARALLSSQERERQRADADAALELALATDDLEAQVMAYGTLADMSAFAGDFAKSAAFARRHQALAERLDDSFQLAMAVRHRAWAEPRLRKARPLAEEATTLLRRCGSYREISRMLSGIAMVALVDEEYEEAEELACEQLLAAEEAGDRFERMNALGNAGLTALFLGRTFEAEKRYRRQLALCRSERYEGWWSEAVFGLAAVAANTGDAARAGLLAGGSAATLRKNTGEADWPVMDRIAERFLAPARAALGEPEWIRSQAEGAALARDELFDLALGLSAVSAQRLA